MIKLLIYPIQLFHLILSHYFADKLMGALFDETSKRDQKFNSKQKTDKEYN